MQTIIRHNLKLSQGTAVVNSHRFHAVLPYNYGMDAEQMLKALGQIIRDARQQKEWTQGDLAGAVGLSVGYISNIEKGYVNPKRGPVVPSDDTIRAFAAALDVPVRRFHSALRRDVDHENHDDHEVIDYLRGKPEAMQEKAYRLLRTAFDEEDAKDNAGNVGKKAE